MVDGVVDVASEVGAAAEVAEDAVTATEARAGAPVAWAAAVVI